ncbi:MAG: type II toxin-antitoxin system VapC family toxin [Caulobacteraceae bacterium]
MLAVDTNVIVRYIVGDDSRQADRARALIDGEQVFIPTSVVLETEWVLRSIYRFDVAGIMRAIRTLAGQPTVTMEQPVVVQTALGWAESGVEFADALHIAASGRCAAFVSFDQDLANISKRVGALQVRRP